MVYYDMEGLSGQDDPDTFRYSKPAAYRLGRQLLTDDVNAVIDGLFAGGALLVDVVDAHGSGNWSEPDILLDRMDPRATAVFRDEAFRPYVDLVEPDLYDAVVVVGMHASTGRGGFASHTWTLGMDIVMNDMPLTETEIIGYAWGRVGVPVILATGDDRLGAQLAGSMPWVEYVTVKTATSASSAELRPVAEVHAEMREAASRALRHRDQARAMRIGEPVRAALRAVPPASVEMFRDVPGLDYDGDSVAFTAADFQAAFDGVIALTGIARFGYQQVLLESVRAHHDGEQIMADYSDRLFRRWLDYESGRWTPPEPPTPPADQRFFGSR